MRSVSTWLGERSYSIYLWHFPLVLVMYERGPLRRLPPDDGYWWRLPAILLLTLVFASVSYHLVERPGMEYGRRLARRFSRERRSGRQADLRAVTRRCRDGVLMTRFRAGVDAESLAAATRVPSSPGRSSPPRTPSASRIHMSLTEEARVDATQTTFGREPRIGVLVVAYNAASTLATTLDRIPEDFRSRISEVFVCDDASPDRTYLVGLGYQETQRDLPLTVIRHEKNLGYGGNQKAGYQLATEHDLDIIVLLHGDGQYAPEFLPGHGRAAGARRGRRRVRLPDDGEGRGPARRHAALQVRRQQDPHHGREPAARLGPLGVPLGLPRLQRAHAVRAGPVGDSDGFNFDTQIIIALHSHGKKIVEIPIPTYYGDEICYVNGMQYAADVVTDVAGLPAARRWASRPASWRRSATSTSSRSPRAPRTP